MLLQCTVIAYYALEQHLGKLQDKEMSSLYRTFDGTVSVFTNPEHFSDFFGFTWLAMNFK